jgi:hypothetical protein
MVTLLLQCLNEPGSKMFVRFAFPFFLFIKIFVFTRDLFMSQRNAAKLSSEPDFSSTENRTVNTLAAAPPSTDSIEQRILRSRDSVIDDRINELLMVRRVLFYRQ